MCKQIVIPYNDVPRNCKRKEYADGWCHLHHPKTVEAELVNKLQAKELKMQLFENSKVGAWARKKHPEIFEHMRDEIKTAQSGCYIIMKYEA